MEGVFLWNQSAIRTLKRHPAVRDALIVQRGGTGEAPRLAAYVVPDPAARLSASRGAEREWLERSRQVWEDVYTTAMQEAEQNNDPQADPYLIIHSWSGLVKRSEEISELMEHSANRIRALRPKRILEIGCGSGQILTRLAPECLDYWGTDISDMVLRNLRARRPLPNVTLRHGPADDFSGIPEAYFDGVILNSVLEFFPGSSYLLRVLEKALQAVILGGFVFVGDTCNLALREAFHYSEQAWQANAEQPAPQIKQVARRRFALDQALCVDPDFFFALPQRWPQISHVEVQLLRGHYYNAISQLHADTHYDVILQVNSKQPVTVETPWLDWRQESLTVQEISYLLTHAKPDVLGITGMPSSRLQSHLMLLNWMSQSQAHHTIGELREKALSQAQGQDLEAWWNLDQRFPYEVDIDWTNTGQDALCDVVFRERSHAAAQPAAVPQYPHRNIPSAPPHTYSNHPMQKQLDQDLASDLIEYLRGQLPAQLLPHEVVFVESLPNPNSGETDHLSITSSEPLLNQ